MLRSNHLKSTLTSSKNLERILTPEQVAEILQIHHLTVLKLIQRQELAASKIGRVYRIRESSISNYLEATLTC